MDEDDDLNQSADHYGHENLDPSNKTFDYDHKKGNPNASMLDKLSKSFSSVRPYASKKKQVPSLDFSNMKMIKDYKDWYSYSKKLEDAITLLREKINQLEQENDELSDKIIKLNYQCQELQNMNRELQEA
jgi:predicted RNase H-like nuclease (RuvC/YqgF family)